MNYKKLDELTKQPSIENYNWYGVYAPGKKAIMKLKTLADLKILLILKSHKKTKELVEFLNKIRKHYNLPSLKNIGSLQYYDLYLIAKEVCFAKTTDWFDDRVNITVYNLFPDSNGKYTELLNSKNPDIKLIGKI